MKSKITIRPVYIILLFIAFSCDDIFESDISEETVLVIAPRPDITTSEQTLSFTWESVEGASSYRLRIVTPSFEHAVQCLADTLITTLQYRCELLPGHYEWSVTACNSAYSSLTTYQYFEIIPHDEQ